MRHFAQLFTWSGPNVGDGTSTLSNILTLAFGVLGGISLIVIVMAGMRMVLSRGNPEALGKLRNTLIYAAVGFAVSLGAAAIIQVVAGRF